MKASEAILAKLSLGREHVEQLERLEKKVRWRRLSVHAALTDAHRLGQEYGRTAAKLELIEPGRDLLGESEDR